jgi:hypothetical protein
MAPSSCVDETLLLEMVHHKLAPDVEARVMTHLRGCAACERSLQQFVAQRERLRSSWRRRHRGERRSPRPGQLPDQLRPEDAGKGSPWWRSWWLAVVPRPVLVPLAVGAVSICVFVFLHRPSPELVLGDGVDRLPSVSALLQLRDGEASGLSADLTAGVQAYERGELKQAVRLLRGAGAADLAAESQMFRILYLGSALARSGRHREALAVLTSVAGIDQAPEPWGSRICWTLQTSLRAMGRTQEADSVLRKLSAEPGEVGDRARALLTGVPGGSN